MLGEALEVSLGVEVKDVSEGRAVSEKTELVVDSLVTPAVCWVSVG